MFLKDVHLLDLTVKFSLPVHLNCSLILSLFSAHMSNSLVSLKQAGSWDIHVIQSHIRLFTLILIEYPLSVSLIITIAVSICFV